jgi:DNA-binding transcriptional MocR family regulator
MDDQAVATEAAAHDVVAHPLSVFFLGDPELAHRGLVLGYGAYNFRQLREGASKLATALKTVARNSRRDSRTLRARSLIA